MGMVELDMGMVEQDMGMIGSDMGTVSPDASIDVDAEQPQTDGFGGIRCDPCVGRFGTRMMADYPMMP